MKKIRKATFAKNNVSTYIKIFYKKGKCQMSALVKI